MTSSLTSSQRQQQPQQYPDDSQFVNLDFLTDVERHIIMSVLDRDAVLRQKEQTRIKFVFSLSLCSVLFFDPRLGAPWTRTFSIYLCPMSF